MSKCLCKCIVTLSSNLKIPTNSEKYPPSVFDGSVWPPHAHTHLFESIQKSKHELLHSINYPSHNSVKAAAGKLAKKKIALTDELSPITLSIGPT